MLRTLLAVVCAGLLAACSGGAPKNDSSSADIARVLDVKSSFGPEFKVSTVAPTAIDPRLLAPQALPPGVSSIRRTAPRSRRPRPSRRVSRATWPRRLPRAMATASSRSRSRRRRRCQSPTLGTACKKVAFAGGGARGLVEVVGVARDRRRPHARHPPHRPDEGRRQTRQWRALQLRRHLRDVHWSSSRPIRWSTPTSRCARRHPAGPRPAGGRRQARCAAANARRAAGTGC